jgi:hypothetical protein
MASPPLTFVDPRQVSSPHITAWEAAQGAHTGASCDEATFGTNGELSVTWGINPLYVSLMVKKKGASLAESFCAQVEREHLHKVLNALTPDMSHNKMDKLCWGDQ